MIRKILISAAALTMLASMADAKAAPCKDAKGRFTKCSPAAAAPAASGVTKDKNGRCHIASGPRKGQFTRCP